MLILTFDLELHDPIKKLSKNEKEKFIFEQEEILIKIFSFLNNNNLHITCFVTNEFVKNYYDFFHKYVVGNHEVACHTSDHLLYNGHNLEKFNFNIKDNKQFLEKEIGLGCNGFRAPGGLVPKNLIFLLKKYSFKYDSSIIPGIMPGRYYHIRGKKEPYYPDFENIFIPSKSNKEILEFPLLTSKIIKLSMNGIFFFYYSRFINLNKYDRKYGTIYLHPCDFKKFYFFDKTYFWDKIKNVEPYWHFLKNYTYENKNNDRRLDIFRLNHIEKNKTN